jgi:transposase-like protein
VFGDLVRVQRCQLHKRRNVVDHLPKSLRRSVDRTMREAYKAKSALLARQRLQRLASWLERQGHTGAARSLREGLEETLTVLKLRLGETLRKTLSSTNPIESTIGAIRRVTRNVKRWRGGRMAERWVAVALFEAERGFRRIKGYRELARLREALAELGSESAREVA